MPAGRPSDYSTATAAVICARISEGQSLREIERADDMPSMTTIFRWLGKHEDFREQYAQAKVAQAEKMAEEILDIADDGLNDWMTRKNSDGDDYEVPNHEHINRSRLRVDSRKWLLSKLLPKKYGEKQEIAHTGDIAVHVIRYAAEDSSPP